MLHQVNQKFPKELHALEKILEIKGKEERVEVIRQAATGGSDRIPSVSFESMMAMAEQFIGDLEAQQDIVDRKLLAKLCLVREECRLLRM